MAGDFSPLPALDSLLHDLRIAFRVFAKARGATALSVISIALGIGLTAGVFSVADARLLRPLAIRSPGGLLQVTSRGDDGRELMYGWPDFLDASAATTGLAGIVAYQRRGLSLATGGETESVLATPVSSNYFPVLGVRAAAGRATVDDVVGRPQAVLGYHLWQRRFGGDAAIVGKTVLFSRPAFVVAGVMPEQFTGLARGLDNGVWISSDAWFSVLGNRRERDTRNGQYEMVARPQPGVTAAQLAAQVDASVRGSGKHKPPPAGVAGTFLRAAFAPSWSDGLLLGGGLVLALVLLLFVACANVAQLRLAQVESRRKELAARV